MLRVEGFRGLGCIGFWGFRGMLRVQATYMEDWKIFTVLRDQD